MTADGYDGEALYFASDFDIEKARHIYKLLKRDLYYETVHLFVRAEIAKFEVENIEANIRQFASFINRQNPEKSALFTSWLNSVSFRLLPKKVKLPNQNDEKSFISNLRTADKYWLSDVIYLCDMPIQLWLISMLWSVTAGVLLDKQIGRNCVGNRLNIEDQKEFGEQTFKAFKYYLPEYNRWRDQAIQVGLETLKSNNDILLIGMDIRRCFYFLKTDWQELHNIIDDSKIDENNKNFCHKITNLLQLVHQKYFDTVSSFLTATHQLTEYTPENNVTLGLPIGLPSSRILANWELNYFDQNLLEKLRPIYYGRYVDDFLIVINNPGRDTLSGKETIEKFFIQNKILGKKSDDKFDVQNLNGIYRIADTLEKKRFEFLEIQNEKLVFHFYAHEGSWAGLSEFQDELNKQASEFRFLPVQETIGEFLDDAHDINYDGNQNKLRSVIGVKENMSKLSNQLYSRILKYWLGNQKLEDNELKQLSRFYQGRNIFDYLRTWERVFTLFIGTKQAKQCNVYYQNILHVINKLDYDDTNLEINSASKVTKSDIIEKILQDITNYLNIALAAAMSFESSESREKFAKNNKKNIKFLTDFLEIAKNIRMAHMVRHQFVRWPLLEYINDEINLINFDSSELQRCSLDKLEKAFEYFPRFIYYHEYALLQYLQILLSIKSENSQDLTGADQLMEQYQRIFSIKDKSISIDNVESTKQGFHKRQISIEQPVLRNEKRLCIGLANIRVLESNYKSSYKPNAQPNISLDRQDDLFHIINESIRKTHCDLIVLPEVSIPYMWLPFLADHARKKRVGIICGLEHWVINGIAYNLVATILPYGKNNSFQNSFISLRIKNHYSPEEILDLNSYGLKIPKSNYFEKIHWNNYTFAVYNCFELTDINARGIFRSELDLLISIAWNKDVNYYSNIIEATARDLHVYIAQANTSDFGDSRIVAPKKTEEKDLIRVKGGENPVLLKGYIDIEELRDFQSHTYVQKDERFKPTPAGFDHDKARKRTQ